MMKLKLLIVLLAISASLFVFTNANAQRSEMKIIGLPPDKLMSMMVGSAWFIYIDGPISGRAGDELESYLIRNKVPMQSSVFLNSPGGSLIGGMELGRAIRKYQLTTSVGKCEARSNSIARGSLPGECYSACALAYLGGVFRFLNERQRFGVHQFSFSREPENPTSIAQIASSLIVTYLQDMGIDTKFFNLAVKADAKSMYIPPLQELKLLDVVNGGIEKARWSIESTGDLIYAKGERRTIYGIQKIILVCAPEVVLFHSIFDPQRRESEIMAFEAHSIEINGATIRAAPISKKLINGYVNIIYKLSNFQVSMIKNSKSLGSIIQFSYEAPIFLGISEMPLNEDGRRRVRGYLNNCPAVRLDADREPILPPPINILPVR